MRCVGCIVWLCVVLGLHMLILVWRCVHVLVLALIDRGFVWFAVVGLVCM